MKPDFVHLHVHSDYSFLLGACKINDLVKRVSALGMKACALTDHGNMLGAIEFYDAALKSGIKPIIGMEAYIAPRSRLDRKEVKGMKEPLHHLTLLVRNEKGYRNLLKLTSASYKEGFYGKPRMDREILAAHHEGVIALSGCSNSEFGQACRTDQTDKALKSADDFKQIFGADNFFLEVQNHGLEEEKKIFQGAKSVGHDLGLRLVATNNVHYMSRDDDKAHDAVLALGEGKLVSDPDRLRYPAPEFYLKSPEEMAQAFGHCPEALKASVEIADRCNLELRFNEIHLPKFDLPPGQEKVGDYLRILCEQGAKQKFGDPIPENVRTRMDYELGVMDKMGFASYFLIVWDLRRFAIQSGMRVGPGRGSAAGSLVSYLLDITLVDPLRYGLIFERFLNPSRKEMPDIDLDFSDEDRGRIIEYIFERYGHDKVAQIITYGTLKARAVLRDVGRVLAIDLKRVDQLAKKIPKVLDISLHDAARMEPEIQKEIDQDPQIKELWEISLRLEGNARHAGKHASGVVICDRSLEEIVPLYTLDEAVMTQYDMNAITKLGILKIDILGLETLTVLDRATKLIEKVQGVKVDLAKIPLDDKDTFAMLGRGTVKGVFQLETSRGMRELVQKMKPDRIDDLIATIALFRPGPLQSGMVESYIRCKHKLEPIKPLHPSIDPILAETNGVILYQEQVMKIANVMAGFTMADADGLRKAMGKKIPEIMAKYKEQFVKGATKAGVKEDTAIQVFDLMAFFAGYGFNKSHSAAYGIISYQTAYLKAKWPVEYMAAGMSVAMGDTDKLASYIEECRQLGIEVLPPDINESDLDFTVTGKKIRFGLGAVKGAGEKAIQSIVDARAKGGRFESVYDFCERIDSKFSDKKVAEQLIRCGAFDSTGGHRAQVMEALEEALRVAGVKHADRRAGQLSIFDSVAGGGNGKAVLPDIPPWPQESLLVFEREVLGCYVTSNPLLRYEEILKTLSTATVDRMADFQDGAEVTIGGMISGLRAMITKTGKNAGQKYVMFKFADLTGSTEAVCFASDFEKNREHLLNDAIVFCAGRIGFREDNPSLRVSLVTPMEKAREMLAGSVRLAVSSAGLEEDLLQQVQDVMKSHPGPCPVFFEVEVPGGRK
ncbi:MAG TPA: DNA polymerase III subunit alpha, partial [Planctomycetota bacterium]|nr:DNA polymerase III subunit alpha [Planctomycetota bacterium]